MARFPRQPRFTLVTHFVLDTDRELPEEAPFDTFRAAWVRAMELSRQWRRAQAVPVYETVMDVDAGTITHRLRETDDEAVIFRVLETVTRDEIEAECFKARD
jgi:hypothetical protein